MFNKTMTSLLPGIIVAGAAYEEVCILTTEIDLDVAGHYARPDVFRLVVNEE
jgi:hypothetical protein